jgi:hypothetical protein
MHAYIRTYIHIRMYIHIHTWTHAYKRMHVLCIHTQSINTYMHYKHVYTCYKHTYTRVYIHTHVYVYTYTPRHILHSLPYLSRHSTYVLPKIVRIHCIYILPQMSSLVVCMYIYMYICHQGPKKPFGHFLGFLISHSHICFDIAA